MTGSDRSFVRLLEYAPIGIPHVLSRVLPFQMRCGLWSRSLQVAAPLLPPLRKRIERNLDLIHPEMPRAERRRFMAEVGRVFGRSWAEMLYTKELGAYAGKAAVEGPGLAVLDAEQSEGRGVILVSGHYGQWEAVRHALRARGMVSGAVYRRNSNGYYNDLFLKNLQDAGEPIFESGPAGVRGIMRHLKSGGLMSMLIDQRYGKQLTVDFLGKPAPTSPVAAELALKLGLQIIPAYGLRDPDDPARFTAHFEAPVARGTAAEMTQAITASLGARVREDPTQWYWLHNRWSLHAYAAAGHDIAGAPLDPPDPAETS